MDFSKYSGMELIRIYGELLSKMREDTQLSVLPQIQLVLFMESIKMPILLP